MNQVAYIIAFRDFRDEEYLIPKEILEREGFKVVPVSSSKGTAIGKLGLKVEVAHIFQEIDPLDYQALIFAGGPGAQEFIEEEKIHEIVRKAFQNQELIAAICIAPLILAKSGILKGKKATVWHSVEDLTPIKELEKAGAEFVDKKVVKDGLIITASGPEAAYEFGEMIAASLGENKI